MWGPDKCSGDDLGHVVVATTGLLTNIETFQRVLGWELSSRCFKQVISESKCCLSPTRVSALAWCVDKAELEVFSAELDQLASLGCQVGNLN